MLELEAAAEELKPEDPVEIPTSLPSEKVAETSDPNFLSFD